MYDYCDNSYTVGILYVADRQKKVNYDIGKHFYKTYLIIIYKTYIIS